MNPSAHRPPLWSAYARGSDLVDALRGGSGGFVVRPAPEDEQRSWSRRCARAWPDGRRAIVLVPEASPMPATTAALVEAFGERVCVFAGGDTRARYRTWLEIRDGAFDVVVGTRPAVFAPVTRRRASLGLARIAPRRIERSARPTTTPGTWRSAGRAGRRGVRARGGLSHRVEAAALAFPVVTPVERRWPKVEVVRPGTEGRAPRLVRALREAKRAFVYAPLPGYGVAQVVPGLRRPGGVCGVRRHASRFRRARCGVWSARRPGGARACGASSFGIRRGGAERVEEWAGRVAAVPVGGASAPAAPGGRTGEILVRRARGRAGPRRRRPRPRRRSSTPTSRRRGPGLAARERALAIWMEAVGWARPDGRAHRAEPRTRRSRGAGARARQPRPVPRRERARRRRPGSRSARRCSGSSGPASSSRRSQGTSRSPRS